MKTKILAINFFVLLNLTTGINLNSKDRVLNDSIIKIEGYKNLYHSGDYYFSGQPPLELLKYLDSNNVDLIVNLRSEKEIKSFKEYAYDEESVTKELKMEYISIPVGGSKDYTRENLAKFANALSNHNGKVLIHCASAYRVTYFMIAYLIKYKGYTFEEAISCGKQLKFNQPLEGLLGEEISMELKN